MPGSAINFFFFDQYYPQPASVSSALESPVTALLVWLFAHPKPAMICAYYLAVPVVGRVGWAEAAGGICTGSRVLGTTASPLKTQTWAVVQPSQTKARQMQVSAISTWWGHPPHLSLLLWSFPIIFLLSHWSLDCCYRLSMVPALRAICKLVCSQKAVGRSLYGSAPQQHKETSVLRLVGLSNKLFCGIRGTSLKLWSPKQAPDPVLA